MSRPSRPSTARIQVTRRPSLSLPLSVPQRTAPTSGPSRSKPKTRTKTAHKLVELPSDPQTKPLLEEEEDVLGYATDAGVRMRERKSAAERMSKAERRRAGFRRITAYGVAEGVRIKLLSSFLKREHNVHPRVYDNALYAMYNLPLLPGYGPASNIRSSTHATEAEHTAAQANMSEAEESGYQGTYFARADDEANAFNVDDGYIAAGSPEDLRNKAHAEQEQEHTDEGLGTDTEPLLTTSEEPISLTSGDIDTVTEIIPPALESALAANADSPEISSISIADTDSQAEVVFFDYGVIVFFGLQEDEERSILDDIANAGALKKPREEDKWEIEELHYAYDRSVPSPRIYHDFFTFKNPSHLLTLSIAHALAQSTLLAYYESLTTSILSDRQTTSIPQTLASTGVLSISRTNAMRLTGRLFRLRRDVVLIGNVLDVPDMFWEEASLRGLYDAVREYFEIGERVRGVEERVAGARDLLDAIHEHLNSHAMERITIIIIWLIVAACLVEVGEVVARLIVHATTVNSSTVSTIVARPLSLLPSTGTVANASSVAVRHANSFLDLSGMSREEALNAVEIMMRAAGK
ncbi:DUF155-domain-containing protein [Peniophora sp. CONT]|nr:DUF155-domain-containing protein [Peniophora sp. CONT]